MTIDTQTQLVVIGASAGGLSALIDILSGLPAAFSLPIVIVLHVPADRESRLADILGQRCMLPCYEIEDKVPLQAGRVYIAPPNYHVLVEKTGHLSLSTEEPVNYSRPAIDILFETAADAYQDRLLGVILTGANSDGAKGLKKIIDMRGAGIIQNPDEAEMSTMPQEASNICPTADIMNLERISSYLKDMDAKQERKNST